MKLQRYDFIMKGHTEYFVKADEAEARIKELEAKVKALEAKLDYWSIPHRVQE